MTPKTVNEIKPQGAGGKLMHTAQGVVVCVLCLQGQPVQAPGQTEAV